jgi:hypothetical protein
MNVVRKGRSLVKLLENFFSCFGIHFLEEMAP